MPTDLKIAIGIATAGRREILAESLRELATQTRLPDKVFICPLTPADFDETSSFNLPFPVIVVTGPRGLPAQRNAILRAAKDYTVLVFLDDDFFCLPSYLAELEKRFLARPDVVAMTGRVIADGVTGSGMDVTSARAALAAFIPPKDSPVVEIYNVYGCNMALRLSTVYANGVNFDENLPLYGWLEDVDFSRQLAPFGKIIRNERIIGVISGAKDRRIGSSNGIFANRQPALPLAKRHASPRSRSCADGSQYLGELYQTDAAGALGRSPRPCPRQRAWLPGSRPRTTASKRHTGLVLELTHQKKVEIAVQYQMMSRTEPGTLAKLWLSQIVRAHRLNRSKGVADAPFESLKRRFLTV